MPIVTDRPLYGGTAAEAFIDASGTPVPYGTSLLWGSEDGPDQITDIRDVLGNSVTVVTGDQHGGFRFYPPAGTIGTLWVGPATVNRATGALRYAVQPTTIGDAVASGGGGGISSAALTPYAPRSEMQTYADNAATVAQTAAAQYTDVSLNNLTTSPNPLSQYPLLMDAGVRLWVRNTFPSAAQGAVDGDLLIYTA